MIYTFYSYKGGVGRSMALANIAELFYQAGLQVLMVDWDLEAPGLERFFPIDLEETLGKPGVMDMLLGYKAQMTRELTIPEGEGSLPFEKPEHFVVDIYPHTSGEGRLGLIPAGRRSKEYFAEYAHTVRTFDWQDFYQNWDGELYFEWLRRQFKQMADVILIDSRTGVTEIGGVCIYQFADTVVMFCAPNQQNLDGTYEMAQNFTAPRVQDLRQGRPLNVLIVPARIERAEGKLLDEFQKMFTGLFREFVPQIKGINIERLWQLGIPYIPKYAFTEAVAVRESDLASAEDMVAAFVGLYRLMNILMPTYIRFNPYEGYSGLPVTGHAFRGREAIFRQIETLWSTSDQLPPIILYGHRRMGKSSILLNLAARAEPDTILVYLDMQDLTLADHGGQLLLDVAEAIQRAVTVAGLDAGPAPVEGDYASLGAARRALNALLARLAPALKDGGRLVLAVDEFELIEVGIEQGRIDPGLLGYLRAINQRHRWLGLIFAGLHTLDELGRDYRSAFYGQAEHLRVSYLSYADAERLVTQPHPDFALEYSPELRQELYTLTYGQPYLLQRLCWELVNAWNERFLKQGESTPRTLTLDDLAPLLTPDFYHGAGYYFDGVWSNVTDAERELMRIMARRTSPWSPDELAVASNLPPDKGGLPLESVHAALELLRRHDVILPDEIRFASELLRRWVEREQATGA